MPYALWQHNLWAALKGKRGQAALREVRDALLALPDKRLIAGAACEVKWDDNDRPEKAEFCLIGAYAFHKRVKGGEAPEKVIEELAAIESEWETQDAGRKVGLVGTLAWELAYRNDEEYAGLTPEQRYAETLTWVESQIQSPPSPEERPTP